MTKPGRNAPLSRTVWILALAQALAFSTGPLVVFVGSLVGSTLAPDPSLATLPVALEVVGTAISVAPLTLLMRRFGRKVVMVNGAVGGAAAALACAWAVSVQSFVGFCLGTAMLGATLAVVQQYRFAAIELVPAAQAGDAAARVLLGGLVAALLGPEVGVWGRDTWAQPFAGSFALLALIHLLAAAVLLLCYRPVRAPATAPSETATTGSRALLRRPVFWAAVSSGAVGWALMSFIMIATPLSMTAGDGHSLAHTKQVIQAHIVAMYLPSLVSGVLIRRIGTGPLMLTGLAAYMACILIGLSGHGLGHYGTALILLGVGWNLLFVGGTALLPQAYREDERFRAQAVNDVCIFSTQALAALGAGSALVWLGWEGLLWLALPLIGLHLAVMAVWWFGELGTAKYRAA
jgi:MFS family permease